MTNNFIKYSFFSPYCKNEQQVIVLPLVKHLENSISWEKYSCAFDCSAFLVTSSGIGEDGEQRIYNINMRKVNRIRQGISNCMPSTGFNQR
jgi:hypothetical protein